MKTNEVKAQAKSPQEQIKQLKKENAIMQKLCTRKGFFNAYFELLKCSKTKAQAFNKVNNLYFQLFGEKRYSNFSVYSKMVKV